MRLQLIPSPLFLGERVKGEGAVLRMKLIGADPNPRVAGVEELPGKSNYFIGKDPSKWRTHVPTYAKVKYEEVYPGVDLVYYGNQRQLEYDFVVAPGVDPNKIIFSFDGAEKIEIDDKGDLVLLSDGSEIRMKRPYIYQEIDGKRVEIQGNFKVQNPRFKKGSLRRDAGDEAIFEPGNDRNTKFSYGFEVAAYDATRPLVIDPVLAYSTYIGGGSFFVEEGRGIAVDSSGNAYVTGVTGSSDFPITPGAFQATVGFDVDAFVTKLNASGSGLIYSTFLGGGSNENILPGVDHKGGITGSIGVDTAGYAYVTGVTGSLDFPTTPGAPQTTSGGGSDAFVTKLNPTGTSLVYSTFLGGISSDFGAGIAVDAAGNAYVTGDTLSTNFPTTQGAFQTTLGGSSDAFIAKISDAPPVLEVTIDIKPGSFPNSINLGSNGTVPVAIFSDTAFDATNVDPLTVTLASAPVRLKGNGTPMTSSQDVNSDGLLDLVVHVSTDTLIVSETDREAVLEVKTFDGTAITGSDTVRVVP